ncbi:putative E3 ubiquitin-protein ligase ipaH4.5 [Pandoraea horticolens]|uniref:Putative E3 ubiquitin-protein ligase ipaH4.5 n=1 Tax=Pandoraea horticolens TaxID=2508298 RepID=A0A5E4ZAY8_9BURK|nr:NEL-type E3 ubiquitin ligase domain-containing protein [Pandoraea horticolens]VVE58531.1 putative E3 ubiquitin-protein ligase ipaH4.5 [Pandoraea horticolens]
MATAGVSIAAARPLPEAVRDWFANDEQAQVDQWRMHSKEAHAAAFSLFLDRLKASVNYNADFKTAVASWLSKLAQDEELRQLAFQVVQGATESCEDRGALTYNTLTKLSHAHAVTRGECDARLDEIVDRGRGAFRLDALEKIARQKAQTLSLVDEIEVYLAYQVQLRDRLELPTDIANMRFFHVAGVTPNKRFALESPRSSLNISWWNGRLGSRCWRGWILRELSEPIKNCRTCSPDMSRKWWRGWPVLVCRKITIRRHRLGSAS